MLVFSKDKYLKEEGKTEDDLKKEGILFPYAVDGKELNEMVNEGYSIKIGWFEEVSL